MRFVLPALGLFVLLLPACGFQVPSFKPCIGELQVLDETTGLVTFASPDDCEVSGSGRPNLLEMVLIEEPEFENEGCSTLEGIPVFVARRLSSDLELGPMDPPDRGVVQIDQTSDVEVGEWIQVSFWRDRALSSGLAARGGWSGRFQWGIPGSFVSDGSCGAHTGDTGSIES